MRFSTKQFILLFALGIFAVTPACGEGDPAGENDEQQDAGHQNDGDGDAGHDVEQDASSVPSRCDEEDNGDNGDDPPDMTGAPDYEANYDLIFYEFAFTEDSPGAELNPIIDRFLDQEEEYPIIVLVELTEIDSSTGDVTVRGGAGLHAGEPGDGEYVWDDELQEPDSAPGTLDGQGQLYATLPLLNFVATVETEEETMKTIIPIRDIDLDAIVEVEADGSEPHIGDGDLEGIIFYDDVEDVGIALQPGGTEFALVDILDEERMNYDFNCDGEADAWALSATFSAEETVIVD